MKNTPAQEAPATGRQKRAIALYCMKLHIAEPLEEQPMTVGEAGRLIRRLQNRLRRKG